MNELVIIRDKQAVTTSLKVAGVFEREHKNVLQAITSLEVPEDFGRLNFQPSSYLNAQNKEQPMYVITRDGFTLLAMGFTGAKAMKFKIDYINAFNRMEAQLKGGVPQIAEIPETLTFLYGDEYEPEMVGDRCAVNIRTCTIFSKLPVGRMLMNLEHRVSALESGKAKPARIVPMLTYEPEKSGYRTFSKAELAKHLGVSVSTVKSRLKEPEQYGWIVEYMTPQRGGIRLMIRVPVSEN